MNMHSNRELSSRTQSMENTLPDARTTSALLRAGRKGPMRPADELAARLEKADSNQWLQIALHSAVPGIDAGASVEDMLCGGKADPSQLATLKDHGKRLLKNAMTDNERVTGLAAYFLAIAAALQHHGTLVGARNESGPREELQDVLLDLAASAQEPWSTMLGEAALRAKVM
jgi:hypothetical protein